MMKSLRQDWLSNVRNDLLAGIVVALALIPEAIAFSIIAGVDPKVGLYASFSIAAIIAFAGGRPGMVSAATGAMALLMVTLVKDHGLQYLLAATVLTGVAIFLGLDIRTVGDMGKLPDSLPVFLLPDVPLNLETLKIIFPVSATLAVVGLLESMMTASIVDDLTDSNSNKNRECVGQGVANIATGFLGGMAGCAMIGQSVINVKSGGRGRLSTLAAGVFLLLMVVFIGDWVARIPMAALVAVMIMVSIGTFNWASIRNLREHPKSSSMVMLATVVVTVGTHDLAKGVLVGVLLSGFFFAHKVGQILRVTSRTEDEGRVRTYTITGQVFFASSERFINAFDYKEVIEKVRIDVSRTHFWDITAVSALDKVVIKFRREATEVEVIGLNEASATLVDKFAVHDKDGADDMLMGH
mgnify:CR=1 FL=1